MNILFIIPNYPDRVKSYIILLILRILKYDKKIKSILS